MNIKMQKRMAGALMAAALAVPAAHGALKDGLVAHLTFDTDLKDISGRNNNGMAVGSPTFAAGQVGAKAVVVGNTPDGSAFNYVTLNSPSSLLFGETNDFTVSLWVQLNDFSGDPAFFSNKDWFSGDNTGYVLATSSERGFQWNFKEAFGDRVDYDGPSGLLTAGTWHHLAVVFQRAGDARTYVDGQLVDTQSMRAEPANASSVDTQADGLAINLGTDGTGRYLGDGGYYQANTGLDDFALWGRALTEVEVLRVYQFGKGGTNVSNIPESQGPFVASTMPVDGDTNVSPAVVIEANVQDGATSVNLSSIKMYFDGAQVTATVASAGSSTTAQFRPPGLLAKNSQHTWKVEYTDTASPAKSYSYGAGFTVKDYVDLTLPTPLYVENFDDLLEGTLPEGWTLAGVADRQSPWLDLSDWNSDNYTNWTVITQTRLESFAQPDRQPYFAHTLEVRPDQFENGVEVTSLITNQFAIAISGFRTGKQVMYMTTRDYALTNQTSVYLYFRNLFEQNQNSLFAAEYSVDGGSVWYPALYCLEPADVLYKQSGGIDVAATFNTTYDDVAQTKRDNEDNYLPGKYGDFILAAVDDSLAASISPRLPDDPQDSKRIEYLRLPYADGQSKVRVRFVNAGTDASWVAGIDDFRLYGTTGGGPVDRPTLHSALNAQGQVVISWDKNVTSFQLESSPTVGAGAAWTKVAGVSGNEVTVPPGGTSLYYRLVYTGGGGTTTPAKLQLSVAGAKVTVSWNADATGYTLESSEAVGGSAAWTTVSGVTGSSVTLDLTAKPKFFRMRK